MARINRVTSPTEIFAGANLILPEKNDKNQLDQVGQLLPGQSLLEAAILTGLNPWSLAAVNNSTAPSDLIAGSNLFYLPPKDANAPRPGSSLISKLEADPLPLHQGDTFELRVYTRSPATITGKLGSTTLAFHQEKENQYVALQGIHAMTSPGLTTLQLQAATDNGTAVAFEESLLVKSGNYPTDPPLNVDPKTIDPAYTKPEDDQVANATAPNDADKLWTEKFRIPVDPPGCIKSGYGNRRSYNGGPYSYFHTGVDYGVCVNNLNIHAPAAG